MRRTDLAGQLSTLIYPALSFRHTAAHSTFQRKGPAALAFRLGAESARTTTLMTHSTISIMSRTGPKEKGVKATAKATMVPVLMLEAVEHWHARVATSVPAQAEAVRMGHLDSGMQDFLRGGCGTGSKLRGRALAETG